MVNNEDTSADGNENYFIVNHAINPMREAIEVEFAGLCSDTDNHRYQLKLDNEKIICFYHENEHSRGHLAGHTQS